VGGWHPPSHCSGPVSCLCVLFIACFVRWWWRRSVASLVVVVAVVRGPLVSSGVGAAVALGQQWCQQWRCAFPFLSFPFLSFPFLSFPLPPDPLPLTPYPNAQRPTPQGEVIHAAMRESAPPVTDSSASGAVAVWLVTSGINQAALRRCGATAAGSSTS